MFGQLLYFFLPLLVVTLPLTAYVPPIVAYRTFDKRAALAPPPTLRVLLTSDQPGVILKVRGRYKVIDPRTQQQISQGISGKSRLLQANREGILWGEEFPGVHQIAIIPDSESTTIAVDGVDYLGVVYAYDVGGAINIVNQVDIEEFLSATLPQRYRQPLPAELLSAVAITARTNSYYLAQRGQSPYWDVNAQEVGYFGDAISKRSTEIDEALSTTRHMVLQRIGKGNWVETPFAVDWRPGPSGEIISGTSYSAITIEEAARLANRGHDAVQLLMRAFPEVSLQLLR